MSKADFESLSPAEQFTSLPDRLSGEADQCRNDGADDIAKLLDEAESELREWHKLKDPDSLHANLCMGRPAQLTRAHLMHLLGEDIDQLRKYAERYLHLREMSSDQLDAELDVILWTYGGWDSIRGADLDAAIDAARSKT